MTFKLQYSCSWSLCVRNSIYLKSFASVPDFKFTSIFRCIQMYFMKTHCTIGPLIILNSSCFHVTRPFVTQLIWMELWMRFNRYSREKDFQRIGYWFCLPLTLQAFTLALSHISLCQTDIMIWDWVNDVFVRVNYYSK